MAKPKEKQIVWVQGFSIAKTEQGVVWDLIGVFPDEESAKKNCTMAGHFIGPVVVGMPLDLRRPKWFGTYHPSEQNAPKSLISRE